MAIYDVNGNPVEGTTQFERDAIKLGVHLMPASLGELNMVRRARQFTDIKWTPSVTIKRGNIVEYDETLTWTQRYQDRFDADTEYTGIPYSHGYYNGANRNFAMVGFEVPISAFASSVTFPASYFNVTDQYNVSSGIYTTYGATCDTLVCYAMGLTTWYGADAGFQTLLDNGVIISKFSSDNIASNVENIHLGDILWKKAVHVAVITDAVVDDNGNLFIEVSEATTRGSTMPNTLGGQKGGVCRRELWGLTNFLKRFGGYTVYRYADVDDVAYEQSPFVTLEGESPMHNLHDRLPLMPSMGDGFPYISGHIPNANVLIKSTSYSYLAVYKDGSLFNTFTVNNATSINVGFSATGNYEAFLYNSSDGTIANMTNRTVSTKWSVVS